MTKKVYEQVSKERYEIIQSNYLKYLEALNDTTKDPVRVFAPISKKMMQELELIREVSKELQLKKEEDMRKAAVAASEAEEEAKKAAEEEKAKKAEETKEETEAEKKE